MWCCPDRQADELFQEHQRIALLASQPAAQPPTQPLIWPAQSQGPQQPRTLPRNDLVSHPLFPSASQAASLRNSQLMHSNEQRKVILWQRSCVLLERSSALRGEYEARSQQLQGLVTEIDRHFP